MVYRSSGLEYHVFLTILGRFFFAPGTFQSEGCSYTSGSSVPAGNLFLQFTAASGQLDVDEVSLTVQPAATSVPEPSSILLLGIGALPVLFVLAMRGKKQLPINA